MKSTTKIPVRSYHIDHFGHLNHARLLELLEEARWRYLEERKLVGLLHRKSQFHVVAEIRVRYLKSASLGEVLEVETEVESRNKKGFVVRQTALSSNHGETLAVATITNVFVNKQGIPQQIDEEVLRLWPDLAGAPWKERPRREHISPGSTAPF